MEVTKVELRKPEGNVKTVTVFADVTLIEPGDRGTEIQICNIKVAENGAKISIRLPIITYRNQRGEWVGSKVLRIDDDTIRKIENKILIAYEGWDDENQA